MCKVIDRLKNIKDPKIFCEQVDFIIDRCKTKERCMKKLFGVIIERSKKDKPLILTWSPTFIQVIFTIEKQIYNNILYEYSGKWTQLTNISTKFNGKISGKSNVRNAITIPQDPKLK